MDAEDTAGFLSGLGLGGGKFEPYENPLPLNISMAFTSTNARGKESSSVIRYTLDTWETGIEIDSDGTNTRMLMDNQEGSMTMINTDNKGETTGFKMRQIVVNKDEYVPNAEDYTITKLGNTREIDGYTCEEYLIEHEDGTTNAWMTNDIEVDIEALMRALVSFASQNKSTKDMPQSFADAGFPIESTTVSKNGKETTTVRYYDINIDGDLDRSVFDTSGIEIMSLGF